MGYSIDPITADCYENTTCLINKFNIRDEDVLAQIEADDLMIATIKASGGITDFLEEIFSKSIS